MTATLLPSVTFSKPPIVEVVCGMLFSTPLPVLTVHIGRFGELVRSELPRIEERDPLPDFVEAAPGVVGTTTQIEFLGSPPLRRTWFMSEDGRNILQLQQDRLLFNWKKVLNDDPYPSFDKVFAKFEQYVSVFLHFLLDQDLGHPVYRQFELTYVNHISNANGLGVGHGNVLVDHIRSETQDGIGCRFLPQPEGYSWTSSYALPRNFGRLHMIARSAITPQSVDQARMMRLDMTARGIPPDAADNARKEWFEVAHEWIIHGFVDGTSPIIQREFWGKV